MSFARYIESMSTRRRLLLIAAVVWACVALAFGGPVALTERMLAEGMVLAVMVQIVGSGLAAAFVVELMRAVLPSAAGWSEQRHYGLIFLVWVVLAALALGVLFALHG
jgi:hypothetical protein